MNAILQRLAAATGLTVGVVTACVFVAAVLFAGSTIRWIALRNSPPEKRREKLGSLAVWWIGLAGLGLVAWGGVKLGAVVFAAISAWGLYEYFGLTERLVADRRGRPLAFLLIPLAYAGVWWNSDLWYAALVPAAGGLLLASRFIAGGLTRGYLQAVGSLVWGVLLVIFFLSHAPRLLAVPASSNHAGGGAGWLLYLVFLTEGDDIFQALWGRRFGRHRITPQISPNKTAEGLAGGVLSTLVLGILLAPWLTPLAEPWVVRWSTGQLPIPYAGTVLACLLISLAGLLGDLNVSALKRDAGVKDTGSLLPSQGGILDRVDSLTFAAPVFYYFVRLCYP